MKSRFSFLFLFGILTVKSIAGNVGVDQHIEQGKQLLALGKLPESLEHFTAAIDAEPGNYLHYFRRATIFLGMNRPLPALHDLSHSITLNPRFVGALVKRGTVQLSFGRFDSARSDYDQAISLDSGNTEAHDKLRVLNEMSEAVSSGRAAFESGDWETCVSLLNRAVESVPWDWSLLETRSQCNERRGDLEASHRDLRQMLRLMPASGAAEDSKRLFSTYVRLAQSVYESGDTEQALRDLRECLKLDPEQSQCLKLHRAVKRTSKHLSAAEEAFGQQRWTECAASARELLPTTSSSSVPAFLVLKARSFVCRCLSKLGAQADADALNACTTLIDSDPKGPFAAEALCARGNMQLDADKIDEAVDDFKKALEVEQELQCAREGRDRAEKIRKQRGKRDYYAILGVSRRATTREIERAYRKLAAKWHPDRFRGENVGEADRKNAERKFIDIAAAKEVLTDADKRRQYDQGVDPLDPEAQAHGGGGNPFQGGNFQFVFPGGFNPFGGGGGGGGGFNPFGGGGGFKFHFG